MIQQAALYLSSSDDLEAARLPVAGRPVVFRALVAAVRAGVRRVAIPTILRSRELDAALATSASARAALVWLDAAGDLRDEPTLILPAAALTPAPALERLLQEPVGRVLAESRASATPVLTIDVPLLAVLRPTLSIGAPLGDLLARELKSREVASTTSGLWFARVTGARAAAEVERRLWDDLGSPIDSPLDTAVHRRLSKSVTRVALALGIAPNAITVSSGVVGLVAASVMARGDPLALGLGLLLYLAAVVLDHADGEVARLTLSESAIGERLDITVDTVVHTALVLALGVAASHVADGGVAAGVLAMVGVTASAVVGYVWPPAPTDAVERGPLDALTSRDGFYAMLLIFIALRLTAPAWLPALMVLIAAGTHAYWVARAAMFLRLERGGGRRP